jgi:hypothetical protein
MLDGPDFSADDSASLSRRSAVGPHRFGPGNPYAFKKGTCPNPGGKPKEGADVIALARELSPDAVRSLHKIAMRGKSERARIEAAVALLDRAFGKPKVTVEGEGALMNFTAIRQIIVSPDGEERIAPAIFGDADYRAEIEDAEVVEP